MNALIHLLLYSNLREADISLQRNVKSPVPDVSVIRRLKSLWHVWANFFMRHFRTHFEGVKMHITSTVYNYSNLYGDIRNQRKIPFRLSGHLGLYLEKFDCPSLAMPRNVKTFRLPIFSRPYRVTPCFSRLDSTSAKMLIRTL